MAHKQCLYFLLFFITAGRLAIGASETQETELWTIWSLQTNNPAQHANILAACQKMQKTSPNSSLLPVAQGLAAWHSLQLGKTNEAFAILENMVKNPAPAAAPAPTVATSPTVAMVGAEMGRRWLTRLDHKKVQDALAVYYRDNVEFPDTLQTLKTSLKKTPIPWTDRWDASWEYKLALFATIKGPRGQRYILQSKTLLASSDLGLALKQPYAGKILLKPISLTVSSTGAQNVFFKIADDRPDKILLSEGGRAAGVTLAYIGIKILILCDGDHWRVLANPAR